MLSLSPGIRARAFSNLANLTEYDIAVTAYWSTGSALDTKTISASPAVPGSFDAGFGLNGAIEKNSITGSQDGVLDASFRSSGLVHRRFAEGSFGIPISVLPDYAKVYCGSVA